MTSIVVLFDPRRPSLVPVEAIEHLTGEVQYTEEMPVAVPWSLPDAHPVHSGHEAPVLLSSDRDHPAVTARLAAGARLISAPDTPRGERLVDAVAMMDKLRTAGPRRCGQRRLYAYAPSRPQRGRKLRRGLLDVHGGSRPLLPLQESRVGDLVRAER